VIVETRHCLQDLGMLVAVQFYMHSYVHGFDTEICIDRPVHLCAAIVFKYKAVDYRPTSSLDRSIGR